MGGTQELHVEPVKFAINKPKERSTAYPAITIERALSIVAEIYKNFRNAFTKREHILNVIENLYSRDLAAASYYTLLNREKDAYQVSELYKLIAAPVPEKVKAKALLRAFESPKLNKQLIEKFDGDQVPKELVAHLSHFHGITEEAAPLAAEVFIKNAKFCGILSESNVLNYKSFSAKLSDPNAVYPEVITEDEATPEINKHEINKQPEVGKTPEPNKQGEIKQEPLLLPEMVNEERVKIRLSGRRFAWLIYPEDLNKIDVAILQKQIEQLALITDAK